MSTGRAKIQCTKNYRLFGRSPDNRDLKVKKHRKLLESMKLYGFLDTYPIIVVRDAKGNLTVKDGQHRLAIAESLGLSVYFTESHVDFDVAIVNSTASIWVLRDYAEKFSRNGKSDYADGLEFADSHKLPIGTAFALLSGLTSFTSVQNAFTSGTFRVKDRKWADLVAGIYGPIVMMNPALKNARFIEACMAVCRVKGFDADRMLQCVTGCRDKLVPYSTRDAYLDMLESIYNFRRSKLVGLKAEATMVMRARNPAKKSKELKLAKAS